LRAVQRGEVQPALRTSSGALRFDLDELDAYARRRASGSQEAALWHPEARARALLESAPDAIIAVDRDGRIVLANSHVERLFGYPRQALLGYHVEMLLPEWVHSVHIEHRVQDQAAPCPQLMGSGLDLYARRHDGTEFPVEIRLSPLSDGGQHLVTAVIRDISARKAMEEELQASEARFRALTEHSSDLTRILDPDGIIRYASTSHQTVLGYDPATVVGRSSFDFMHPDDVERARTALAEVVAEGCWPASAAPQVSHGGRRRLVKRVRHADGTYRSFESIFDNQLDNPAVRGVVVNARDITERLAAEAAQRASEAHFRSLVQGAPVGVCILNEHGIFEEVNGSYAALLGYQPDELVGQHFQMVFPELLRAMATSSFEQVLASGAQRTGEQVLLRKDGGTRSVLGTSISLRAPDGRPRRAAFAMDIDERKRAERAIEEARAFAEAMDRVSFALAATLEPDHLYQIILEQAMVVLPCDYAVIFLYRDGWACATASRGAETVPPGTRLFPSSGPARPWLATDHSGVFYVQDTDLEPRWVHLAPQVGERRFRSVMGVALRIEGEAIGAFQILSHTPQRYDERHLEMAEAFGARIIQALRNAHRYAEEQQRAREAEEFAQLQRDFLGIVSHELLSPITATQGLAQVLRKQWSRFDEEDRDRILEGIGAAAKRQQRLVEDLLDVSRAEVEGFRCERQPFALRPVLERVVAEVQDRYRGQRIDLQGPDEVAAEGDAGRTQQILINLIDNAVKYSPEGNPVTVSWGQEAGQLVVRVRDYGLGISETGREQLFTRFGQLAGSAARAGGSSTGLGLYLSRLLARAMGGELDLESTGPHGSTFRLLLPSVLQT
jgi:PAS domain S-box-containing protein